MWATSAMNRGVGEHRLAARWNQGRPRALAGQAYVLPSQAACRLAMARSIVMLTQHCGGHTKVWRYKSAANRTDATRLFATVDSAQANEQSSDSPLWLHSLNRHSVHFGHCFAGVTFQVDYSS